MPEPGEAEYAGVWDGSLGEGFGGVYMSRCTSCSEALIGWAYGLRDNESGFPFKHIRWDGRRSKSSGPDAAFKTNEGIFLE